MLKLRFLSVRTRKIFFKNNIRDHSLFIPGGGLARMRSGPRQIQDSQKGGGVINKSAHKEGGAMYIIYLIFYFCLIFKQMLSVLLGLTVHGLQAS